MRYILLEFGDLNSIWSDPKSSLWYMWWNYNYEIFGMFMTRSRSPSLILLSEFFFFFYFKQLMVCVQNYDEKFAFKYEWKYLFMPFYYLILDILAWGFDVSTNFSWMSWSTLSWIEVFPVLHYCQFVFSCEALVDWEDWDDSGIVALIL